MNAPADDHVPAEPVDWFSTRGRRGRRSFVLNFLLVNFCVAATSGIAEAGGELPRLVAVACALAGTWINLCLVAQRLHDMGRSGWLQIVPFALGLAGIALLTLDHPLARPPGLAMLLTGWLGFAFWLALAPGTPGSNGFGSRER
ncbi:MAG TPA: DUF805 domain-containing protein [Geminicoccus sp.]|uniref:DUF805 domain-containing protein n=1 Tax=Geminicoccus sp. TaxID=2024832 RepID=UPI002E34070D|nr:DUF805 domain-containing protein [Geminicoccus sp.]HEX2526012.1 DUF805 domain-containing protein [Geminicoccus sp.]